jgi:hypothetical protein
MENSTEQSNEILDESPIVESPDENVDFDYDSLTQEEKERYDEINELIKAEKLEPTTAINILINAVQVSYDKEHFNDLDRYLISKSLSCLKSYSDSGEDIVIKVS